MKEKESEYQRAKRKKPNLYESPTPTRKSRSFLEGVEERSKVPKKKKDDQENKEGKKEDRESEYEDENFACLKKNR